MGVGTVTSTGVLATVSITGVIDKFDAKIRNGIKSDSKVVKVKELTFTVGAFGGRCPMELYEGLKAAKKSFIEINNKENNKNDDFDLDQNNYINIGEEGESLIHK